MKRLKWKGIPIVIEGDRVRIGFTLDRSAFYILFNDHSEIIRRYGSGTDQMMAFALVWQREAWEEMAARVKSFLIT